MQLDLDIEPSRVAVDPYNWSFFLGLSVLAYAVDACVMELLLISVTIMCKKGRYYKKILVGLICAWLGVLDSAIRIVAALQFKIIHILFSFW